jgi:hypothetical protein
MEFPEAVQANIDVLKDYIENEELSEFNIFHMYPGELCYPDGYFDSRWFELVGYNYCTMEFRKLGKHDGLRFDYIKNPKVDIVRIFADGSTLIRFDNVVSIEMFQEILISSL